MFMSLKPDAERLKTRRYGTGDREPAAAAGEQIPGAILYLQAFQDLRIGGRNTATEYQYTLTADKLKDLNEWGPKLKDAMDKLPQIKDVATDQQQQGIARTTGDRPGDGKPAGSFAVDDRCDFSGCVCADAGFNDIHAAESVSRGAGGRG